MKTLLLVFALCALTAAFAPREERALNEDETTVVYCAPDTPCAWTTYNPHTRIIETRINNTYCICTDGLSCKKVDDNKSMNVVTEYCKPHEYEELEL